MKLKLWFVLPFLIVGSNSLPAPFTVEIALPKDSGHVVIDTERDVHIRHISNAEKKANEMLSKMDKISQHHNEHDYDHILRTCFGGKYLRVLAEIQEKIKQLTMGTFNIKETLVTSPDTTTTRLATWTSSQRTGRGYMSIYPRFYALNEHRRALTLIHEASHALCGTHDIFKEDYTPVRHWLEISSQSCYHGYLHMDFKLLREKAPPKSVVLNADSWMLFAHLAYSGFVDFDHENSPMTKWELADTPRKPSGNHPQPDAHGPTTSKPNSPLKKENH